MKTPTELLVACHQAAVPKLDDIRREVLARQRAATGDEEGEIPASFLTRLWLELVLPFRQVWIGLAAVWVLLVFVNLWQRDDSPSVIAKTQPTAEMMLALRSQERRLAELLSDQPPATASSRPPNISPPRSEALVRVTTV